MSNRFLPVLALFGLAAGAMAEVRWGQVEIAFFRVRGEDGRMVDLPTKGIVLPVRMERIKARPITEHVPPRVNNETPLPPAARLVYSNDLGSNYFYDPDGASQLDDINILPEGNGELWYDLTVGCNTVNGNAVRVMNRQLGWQSYVTGRGTGVQAFDQLVFDVGWVFQPGQFPPGTWKFTIPIHNYWAQIPANNRPRVPNGLIYFAQEWRAYNTQGEGAFLKGDFSVIFSGDGDPTVGFSEDGYWNDWEPTDGIFSETEADYFGGAPNQANFLMSLTTGQTGVTDTIKPTSVQLFRGLPGGGNVGSWHFVDQNYYRANKGFVVNSNEAPIQLIVEGFSSTAALTGLSLDMMTQVNTPGLQQKLEVFNFVTNQWVTADTRSAPTVDTRITVSAPGTPSDYVDVPNGNVVRMKVSYKQVGPVTQSNWGCRVDLGNWLATHN